MDSRVLLSIPHDHRGLIKNLWGIEDIFLENFLCHLWDIPSPLIQTREVYHHEAILHPLWPQYHDNLRIFSLKDYTHYFFHTRALSAFFRLSDQSTHQFSWQDRAYMRAYFCHLYPELIYEKYWEHEANFTRWIENTFFQSSLNMPEYGKKPHHMNEVYLSKQTGASQ